MVNSPTPNFNRVELRGTYVGLDGSPIAGSVTFTARAARLVDLAALIIIVGRPIVAPINTSGQFAVPLPATDDPDIGIDFTYQVVENFPGGETYDIELPIAAEPTGIDLAAVSRTYPVTPAEGAALVSTATYNTFLAGLPALIDARIAAAGGGGGGSATNIAESQLSTTLRRSLEALLRWDGITGTQPLRNTVTTDTLRPVRWRQPVMPPTTTGYFIDGVDVWEQTP